MTSTSNILPIMFSVRKIVAQSITSTIYRNFARVVRRDRDPGINRRKNALAFNETDEDIDIDDMESDFMDAHKLHVQHEKEMEKFKEREQYFIVRQKYFKDKFPNFLTWHDKEQIRYLHRTDPEEWTIDKLSEGFPALHHVIKKIITSDWTKTKQHKITNHDASVQKHWQLFKEGKLSNLPTELVEHLNKFTNRALNLTPFVVPATQTTTIQANNKCTSTEYADIIKSYERIKKVPQIEEHLANVEENRPRSETYMPALSNRQKHLTLNELQQTLTKKIEMGKTVDEEEKYIVRSVTEEEQVVEKPQDQIIDLSQTKYQESVSVENIPKTQKDISHLNFPEKIKIPKNLFKKGSTYKLNDCYYDYDGEFLYRVPGMG